MFDMTFANATGTGSVETSTNLLNDRINLIAATTLLGFTYGIMTALYCMTTYFLLKKLFRRGPRSGSHPQLLTRLRTEWRKTLFYIVYTSVLFILASLYTAGNSQNAIVAYVNNRLYPEGPYQYYLTFMAGQWVMIMIDVASLIILWMTDALILCRFIVFYYNVPYARWVIPLPCAMYAGVVVLSTLVLQGEVGGKIFYFSENMLLAYYALSFSLNVISTVLVAARLFWHKIQLERVFGPKMKSPYLSIATMLIESAALYGVWSLVFLILCILRCTEQTIVLATVPHIQVIAPLLIILWIARDKAWNENMKNVSVHDDGYGEVSTPNPHLSSTSGDVGRSSFGSRSAVARNAGEYCVQDARPCLDRNPSWSKVVAEGGGGVELGLGHGDDDVNVIELGVYSSRPSSIIDDLKR